MTFVEIGCFDSQFSANVAVKAVKAKASVIQLICKQNIRTFFIRAGAVISLERLEQNNWFGSQKRRAATLQSEIGINYLKLCENRSR